MSDANPTLKESIEKAVAEVSPGYKEGQEQENVGESEDNTPEGESEDKPDDKSEENDQENPNKEADAKDEVDDEEIQTALSLLRDLRNPDKSSDLIRSFAVRAGLISENQDLTKKEETDLKSIITKELGEEYPDIADKISKIIGEVDAKHEKKIEALRAEIRQDKAKAAETEFTREFESFISTNKLTEAEAKEMIIQIQELPPTNNITLTKYLTKMHKLAGGEAKDNSKRIDQNTRRAANLKQTTINTSSEANESRIKNGSRLPTVKEAVNAAMRGEKLEE